MFKIIDNIYRKLHAKLTSPPVIKRSSLAHHKNPPKIAFIYENQPEIKLMASRIAPSYVDAKFYVLSDLHYYSTKLGCEGEDWDKVYSSDRKLFIESEAIIEGIIKDINKSRADFIIITGDITKDGELFNHQKMVEELAKLRKNVYVIPGNHDILNPEAASFKGNREAIATATYDDFAKLYHNFGYSKALSRDAVSLSYMVEVKKNLCLLALDSTWPVTKIPNDLIVDGKLRENTWRWMEEQLIWAKSQNKAVFVAMHHPFIEHWPGQLNFMPEYIIENHQRLVDLFLTYSVRFAFVGHFHAQTVSSYQGKWRKIYQIMTPSAISYPCSYRRVNLTRGRLKSETINVKHITGKSNTLLFKSYAHRKLRQAIAYNTLLPFKLMHIKQSDREKIIDMSTNALAANYAGTAPCNTDIKDIIPSKNELSLMGRLFVKVISYVVIGLWDNQCNLKESKIELELGD